MMRPVRTVPVRRVLLLFLPILIAAGCATQPDSTSPFQFQDNDRDGRLTVEENGEPVLVYNYGMQLKKGVEEKYRRCCYIHPLYGMNGKPITQDFPEDHPHHRGVSWMWPHMLINGREAQLWHPSALKATFDKWNRREVFPDRAHLSVRNSWELAGEPVGAETVRLTVHKSTNGSRAIDVHLTFQALNDPITIMGKQRKKKGYGGFIIRFAPANVYRLRTNDGMVNRNRIDRKKFRWVDLTATFKEHQQETGAAVFVHPDHPGYPIGWTLRRDYAGIINAAWPGLNEYTLKPDQPLHLRYRLIVHDGEMEQDTLQREYQKYVNRLQTSK